MNPAILTKRATSEVARPAFWEGQLGYAHSLLVTVTALLIGVFFHFNVGYKFMSTPEAFIIGSILASAVVFGVARRYRSDRVVTWLCGIPFAITVTAVAVLLAAVGGYMSQDQFKELFAVETMFGSWPFIAVAILMQINLIGSAGRRAWPLNRVNVQYQLMHGGLALAMFGGAYGSVGLERDVAVCFYGVPTGVAFQRDGSEVHLPFELTLKDFQMERFAPTLAIAKLNEKAKDGMDLVPGSAFVSTGMTEKIGDYRVRVEKFYPKAAMVGDGFVEYGEKTSAPAALVSVMDGSGKELKKGWVCSGGIDTPGAIIEVDKQTALVMPEPRPKKFRSELTLAKDGQKKPISIEVNEPYNIGPYRLYQLSYDEKMGEASHYSVVEVVQDRSIPVVYAGMFALLLGVAMMMWKGVNSPMRGPRE